MSISDVPLIQFTDQGLVLPEDSAILSATQSDINAAFGNQLTTGLDTPQGQLASSYAAVLSAMNDEFAYFVSMVDPDTSRGFMQDAIGKLYFMTRKEALPTVVDGVVCVGAVGTVIPAGSLAMDRNTGKTYASTDAVTIPAGGSVTTSFVCTETGPIACAANSLDIYRAIAGWDTVNNPAAGTTGRDVESPQDFEYRRRISVAVNAQGSLPSIRSAVFALNGVIDVYVTENKENTVSTVGPTNYPLAPHSIYVAVVGGDSDEIANAIWRKKSGTGCNMNGNTTVTVPDNSYDYPQPTYEIKFERPPSVGIKFLVTLQNNPRLPANITDLVKSSVMASFVGSDGGQRARIGGQIFGSRYYAGISAISPAVAIIDVLVGISAPTQHTLAIGIDQSPTLSPSDISVELL